LTAGKNPDHFNLSIGSDPSRIFFCPTPWSFNEQPRPIL
jgi:hypothetical protein